MIKKGQRWRWKASECDFIIEANKEHKNALYGAIVQIIFQKNSHYTVGSYDYWTANVNQNDFVLLNGQDAP